MEGVVEKRAVARFVRVSPTKVRQVLRIIRGKNVEEAEVLLRLASRPVARTVSKVLKSAVSNVTSGERKVSRSDLYVKSAFADGATILKRFLPRAQGRATPILKHSCHITILVAGRPGAPKGGGAAAAEKAVVKKERKRGPLSRSLLPGRSR